MKRFGAVALSAILSCLINSFIFLYIVHNKLNKISLICKNTLNFLNNLPLTWYNIEEKASLYTKFKRWY